MKPPLDELSVLWQSGKNPAGLDQAQLLEVIEQRRRAFDRSIRARDLRESIGGLLVTVLFVAFALRGGSPISLAGDVWLAACGLWIVFYLRRYSGLSRKPSPDQSLASYRAELLERYDRQIRLLKTAKYWYVLPLWLGLMILSASSLSGGHWVAFLAQAALFTAVNAGVWWLNEGPGVRAIQRKRQELALLLGEEGVSK